MDKRQDVSSGVFSYFVVPTLGISVIVRIHPE